MNTGDRLFGSLVAVLIAIVLIYMTYTARGCDYDNTQLQLKNQSQSEKK